MEENQAPQEEKGPLGQPDPRHPEVEPAPPATPLKRIWAWVGAVYMVIVVLLMTYLYGNGHYLQGIAPLMLCPAVAGVGASVVWWHKTGTIRSNVAFWAMLAACVAALAIQLVTGIPALLTNFGG